MWMGKIGRRIKFPPDDVNCAIHTTPTLACALRRSTRLGIQECQRRQRGQRRRGGQRRGSRKSCGRLRWRHREQTSGWRQSTRHDGSEPSSAHAARPTTTACSTSTSCLPRPTRSSPPRSRSSPGSTTPTSTQRAGSALTFSKALGPRLSP